MLGTLSLSSVTIMSRLLILTVLGGAAGTVTCYRDVDGLGYIMVAFDEKISRSSIVDEATLSSWCWQTINSPRRLEIRLY